MSPETRALPERSDTLRTDGLYVLVAGLYGGVLLTPIVVLALSRRVADAGTLYVGLLVALTGIAGGVGWAVRRRPTVAVRLGRSVAVWFLVVLPLGWLGVFGATAVGVDLPRLAFPLAVFGTAGGAFLGIALVAMSRTRHAAVALEGATETVVWEARWPRRWRRAAGAVLVVTYGVGTLGIVAGFVFGREWGWSLYYLVIVGTPFMNLLNPRTFRATDAGLVVGNPVQRQFRPWAAFSGYERSGDSLVIRPAAWWRPAHRCDMEDVEDVDAVVSALDEHLSPPVAG